MGHLYIPKKGSFKTAKFSGMKAKSSPLKMAKVKSSFKVKVPKLSAKKASSKIKL